MEKRSDNIIYIKEWTKRKKKASKLALGPNTLTREAAVTAWNIRDIRQDESKRYWEKVITEGGTALNFIVKAPGLMAYSLFQTARGKETMSYGPSDPIGRGLLLTSGLIAGLATEAALAGDIPPLITGSVLLYGIYSGLTSHTKTQHFEIEK